MDFKTTLTYKAVHLKQPPSLAKHLKLKFMHLNTPHNDLLLLQHPWVGTNSYGLRALECPQFGINFHTKFVVGSQ